MTSTRPTSPQARLAAAASHRPSLLPPRSRFQRQALEGTSSYNPTVLQFGPDARLYVAQQDGKIKAYEVVRKNGRFEVVATETIEEIRWIPNHDDDGSSVTDVRSFVSTALERLGL